MQAPQGAMTYVVRAESNPTAAIEAVKAQIWAVDKLQTFHRTAIMEDLVETSFAGSPLQSDAARWRLRQFLSSLPLQACTASSALSRLSARVKSVCVWRSARRASIFCDS